MSTENGQACQYAGTRPCPHPVFAKLDFVSRDGLRWSELTCQADQERRAEQVKADGGACVGAHVLQPVATS